jgi:hypothetical protein
MRTWCHAWMASSDGKTVAGLDNGKRRCFLSVEGGGGYSRRLLDLGGGDNARLASDYGIREHVWISVAPSHSRLLQVLVNRTGVLHPSAVNGCPEKHPYRLIGQAEIEIDIARRSCPNGVATSGPCRAPAHAPHFPVKTGHRSRADPAVQVPCQAMLTHDSRSGGRQREPIAMLV